MSSAQDYPLMMPRTQSDPYSPSIVEDLLNSVSEWRPVQDIIRLTFKALSDLVKVQGSAIKEVESGLSSKANKSELNTAVSVKANVSDLSRGLAELRNSLETKMSMEDIYSLVDEKVSKNDLHYYLGNKVNYEDMRTLMDGKADLAEMQNEIRALRTAIEEIRNDTYGRAQNSATQQDLAELKTLIDSKASITEMNEALEEKTSKQFVSSALNKKLNRNDLESALASKAESESLRNLWSLVESKADSVSLDVLTKQIDMKPDRNEVHKLISFEVSARADQEEIDSVKNNVSHMSKSLQNQINEIDEMVSKLKLDLSDTNKSLLNALEQKCDVREIEKALSGINKKAELEKVNEIVQNSKNEMWEQIQKSQQTYRQLEESMLSKVSKSEYSCKKLEEEVSYLKESLKIASDQNRSEIQETVKYLQNYTLGTRGEDLKGIRNELENFQNELDEVKSSKLDKRELRRVVGGKVEVKELQDSLDRTYEELIAEVQNVKGELQKLLSSKEYEILKAIESKPDYKEIEEMVIETKSYSDNLKRSLEDFRAGDFTSIWQQVKMQQESLDNLGKEILLKPNIKDICSLLDMKPNIDDINQALESLHSEIDSKVSQEEFKSQTQQQNSLNEIFCSENCTGRWIWKSGQIKTGHSIPWEIQSSNTCPDNFLWEKSKTSILTIAPGLYEVGFAFFSRKKPSVQLVVNGEVLISRSSTESKHRAKQSNLTGVSLVDFVALPARARVSVTYSGEPAEGFLSLRKL